MNFTITTFYIMILFLLVSCDQSKTIVEKQIIQKNVSDFGGGDFGGGGNGIDGKPIESFHVDLAQTDLYQKEVEPILLRLIQLNPSLAGGFYRTLKFRNWYFVPIALSSIPSTVIGVPFPVDQLAIQTFHKIWIDKNQFDKMSRHDQKILIIHEMVMGTRILGFRKNFEKCRAYVDINFLLNGFKPDSSIENMKRKCDQFDPSENLDIHDIDLNFQTYNNIQNVTSMIAQSNLLNFSGDDLEKMNMYIQEGKILDYTSIKEYLH